MSGHKEFRTGQRLSTETLVVIVSGSGLWTYVEGLDREREVRVVVLESSLRDRRSGPTIDLRERGQSRRSVEECHNSTITKVFYLVRDSTLQT